MDSVLSTSAITAVTKSSSATANRHLHGIVEKIMANKGEQRQALVELQCLTKRHISR